MYSDLEYNVQTPCMCGLHQRVRLSHRPKKGTPFGVMTSCQMEVRSSEASDENVMKHQAFGSSVPHRLRLVVWWLRSNT